VLQLFGLLALAGFGHHGLHEQAIGPRGPSSRAFGPSRRLRRRRCDSPTIWATRLAHAAGERVPRVGLRRARERGARRRKLAGIVGVEFPAS
jgi:hypothetical protein